MNDSKHIKKQRITAHIMMTGLIILWGFDYVPAKICLEVMDPMVLLFFKFVLALMSFVVILLGKAIIERKKSSVKPAKRKIVRLRDIPLFIIVALTGQLLYFKCEYTAVMHLPAAIVTIILALVPVMSVLIEWALYKRKPNAKIIVGVLSCVAGIVLIVGADVGQLFGGGYAIGYICAFIAVIFWNVYNFIVAELEEYDIFALVITETICTLLLCAPFIIHLIPAAEVFTPRIIVAILLVGLLDTAPGYVMTVYALQTIGPTTCSIYNEFLPVSTAIFGALLLGQTLSTIQLIGGIIVITAGYLVIREKGKLDM